ncbi:MAG: exo-alpha-sialidase [Chitinophagaceae bacterium]|nr:exo-alpha-sialidase [Chitinophagaceae bacterium]
MIKYLLSFSLFFIGISVSVKAQDRWDPSRANAWYTEQGWLMGCNYTPSNAVNQLEMWQADTFDSALIDHELGLAEKIGMNSIRVFLHDLLFEQDPEGFQQRMDIFLSIARKHNVKVLFVFFDSCWNPFPHTGKQPEPTPFVHNSQWVQSPGASALNDTVSYGRLKKYVQAVVKRFGKDERVLGWDIWNEPDNMGNDFYRKNDLPDKIEKVNTLLPLVFAWAREEKPLQPLTSGIWAGNWSSEDSLNATQKIQVSNSDVISFHNYDPAPEFEKRIKWLDRYNRPVLCTEYMSRGNGNTFQSSLPLAKQYHVAAMNWGFVSGKTQTIYPWDSWTVKYTKEPEVWFHDIFRKDGTPYSEDEIKLIRQINDLQRPANAFSITWSEPVLINNMPKFKDAGKVKDAVDFYREQGTYGSQYARMVVLADGNWLAGYTISRNNGYSKTPRGGLELQISSSTDKGKHWKNISIISDPGHDLDNTQMIQLKDGSMLLACRTVRWQESYVLPVYKSNDKGKTWKRLSIIDSTSGKPGALGNPDKGIYEPHLYLLDDGRVAVMYANEKHVTATPSYSQIISEKISDDNGKTWNKELWIAYEPGHPLSRPGMPVWTKMKNGKFIVVYEVCGPEKCGIRYKISDDGKRWPVGLGETVPGQNGGPYILSLTNGNLLVTSNAGNLSVSDDYGKSWSLLARPWNKSLWGALYQTGNKQVSALNSPFRPEGGNNVQIKQGTIKP